MKLLKSRTKVLVVCATEKVQTPEVYGNAVVVSQTLQAKNCFTTCDLWEFRVAERETRLGWEKITRDLPMLPERAIRHLGSDGVITMGAAVERGDVLVGKVRPVPPAAMTAEEKVLKVIFNCPANLRNASLLYPFRDPGVVLAVYKDGPANGSRGISVVVEVAVRRALQVGDELTDKEGHVLTVAAIRPACAMPTFGGTPVDILVAPEAAVNACFKTSGALGLGDRGAGRTRGAEMLLEKRSGQSDVGVQARASADAVSLVTAQPVAEGDLGSDLGVSWEEAQAIARAGYTQNLRELLSVKSDGGSRARGATYLALVRPQEGREVSAVPEAFRQFWAVLKGMGIAPALRQEDEKVSLALSPALPAQALSWSKGEVVTPETISDRSGQPVAGGLFCERMFGSLRERTCSCGGYHGRSSLGKVCPCCGVRVTGAGLRRKRFGHLHLSAPVLLYGYREFVAGVLGWTKDELDRVLQCEDTQTAVRPPAERGASFVAEELAARGVPPDGIVTDILSVIPPVYRPIVENPQGPGMVSADLNFLYECIIVRSQTLKKLEEVRAPAIIRASARRQLQEAVDALFVNRVLQNPVLSENNRPLRSLADHLEDVLDRQGRKHVEYVARGVVVPDATMPRGTMGIPVPAARDLLAPLAAHALIKQQCVSTLKAAKRLLAQGPLSEVREAVSLAAGTRKVLAVTSGCHVASFALSVTEEGEALRLHPDDARALGLAFRGERLTLHLPIGPAACAELAKPALEPLADVTSVLKGLTWQAIAQAAWSRTPISLTSFDALLLGSLTETTVEEPLAV